MQWHIAMGSQQYVARSLEELSTWIRESRVQAQSLVYHPTLSRWMPAVEVPELRHVFAEVCARSGPGASAIALVTGAVLVIVGFLVVAVLVGSVHQVTTVASSSETPQPVVDDRQTGDYQRGYERGRQEGVDHANSGAGMPLPIGMNGMANLYAQTARPTDEDAWKRGFKDGFTAGFTSVKSFTRDESKWEQLSWSNARAGVKLYDYGEKHDATIQEVNRGTGLIIVRYKRDGSVEPKLLDSVAPYWWVRRRR